MTMATNSILGLDLLATAVIVVDEAGYVRYMNPAAENLFGLSNHNAQGAHLEALFKESHVLTAAMGYAREHNCSYSEHGLTLSANGHAVVHLSCTVTPVDMDSEFPGGGYLFEFRHTDQ
jgi:two-component system nitrogen regulation sensor histidine kinase GlnL